jgi:hypothetical protein
VSPIPEGNRHSVQLRVTEKIGPEGFINKGDNGEGGRSMYASLGRRGGQNPPDDGRDRQRLADLHTGSARDFLLRHDREAAKAARSGKRARVDFAQRLFRRAANTRNLKLALDQLASEGGGAPGPDGVSPSDLGPAERWELARALEDSIRRATYRPGPGRIVTIPKGTGRGHRTLVLQDLPDRAVQRAILQVFQPFVDPRFLETSFGSRPGLGREHALAKAEAMAEVEGRWTWVAEDIQNAFDQVPLIRLLDVVRTHAPADDFLSLVDVVIRNHTNKGLRQGGAITPPTMLRTTLLEAPFKRGRTDPIHDAHLPLVDLDSLHQGPDDFPARVPVRLLQPLRYAIGERFQLANHQP